VTEQRVKSGYSDPQSDCYPAGPYCKPSNRKESCVWGRFTVNLARLMGMGSSPPKKTAALHPTQPPRLLVERNATMGRQRTALIGQTDLPYYHAAQSLWLFPRENMVVRQPPRQGESKSDV